MQLVKDKLFINGKRFVPTNKPTETTKKDSNMYFTSQRNYSNTNRQNPANRWTTTRTFVRSNPPTGGRHALSATPTHNVFAPLQAQAYTDTPRRSHAGKTKATSTLENIDTFKKYKDTDSLSVSEAHEHEEYLAQPQTHNRDNPPESSNASNTNYCTEAPMDTHPVTQIGSPESTDSINPEPEDTSTATTESQIVHHPVAQTFTVNPIPQLMHESEPEEPPQATEED